MPDANDNASSTLLLISRARSGDASALEELFGRCLADLRKWASGRLPQWARDGVDTQDVVQETLLHTFKRIDGFEHRGQGALRAYLRQAVVNRIRDEIRRAGRRPAAAQLDEALPSQELSPVEAALISEAAERYEQALRRLTDRDRELVIARLELGLTYGEIAVAVGRPSSDAARMAVSRALLRLAEELDGPGNQTDESL